MSESRIPAIIVRLPFEGRAEITVEGLPSRCAAQRLAIWLDGDPRQSELFCLALELAHIQPDDLGNDELLARLGAALAPPLLDTDPYAAVCPIGTFQGRTLRSIVDHAEPFRTRWFRWARELDWRDDRAFERALRAIAKLEGIEPGPWEQEETP